MAYMCEMSVQFIDLAAQQARLRPNVEAAIGRVLDHGVYIMGPEVKAFEQALAAFCGAKHALGCANGTDALQLALMALGAGPGDAVFCPSFTFAATAEVVPLVGATPVFADVDRRSFNMDPESLKRAILRAREEGLTPRGVIAVDLFGLAADYGRLEAVAKENRLWLVSDSAQGFGARRGNKMTGSFGDVATTSFFPAKPLGCYGDGGAIFTPDDELAAKLDSLRIHGKGSDKYDNVRIGLNSRLDTIQAAILLEKLAIYPEELAARERVARRYAEALAGHPRVAPPHVPEGCSSVWAQYTLILAPDVDRAALQTAMKAQGVPTMVYYPQPLHQQTAYRDFPGDPQGLKVSEDLAARVLSLPMHPYLSPDDQDKVVSALQAAL